MLRQLVVFLLLSLVFAMAPQRASAAAFHLAAQKSQYGSELEGSWKVVTEVVWSNSPYVSTGAVSESELQISDINGVLYPNWQAGDWVLVRNKVIEFNFDKSLHWERESKLKTSSDYWFVRSINKFDFSEPDDYQGVSFHKQYLNGEYVGSYKTKSYLSKTF